MDNLKKPRHDVNATHSDRKGFLGLIESHFRKFRGVGFAAIMAPIALLYIFCLGVSLAPGITLFQFTVDATATYPVIVKNLLIGFSLATGFCLYGLTLIFVVPAVNKLLPLKVVPQRTTWYSLGVVPWYYHNALTYLVRYTFLEFITPTPLNKLFYQMMGMKVGKGTIINTSNISDPCLIEIGENVTIGGSATLLAHYGMKGFLIIDRLVIKDRAVIGLKATVFGDVEIGVGAMVKPNEVIMPKTRIPDVTDDKKAA
jgi:hypothetical protein